ncbi:MAG: hypothetical protein ACSLE1_17275 [Sphingobium sp.]
MLVSKHNSIHGTTHPSIALGLPSGTAADPCNNNEEELRAFAGRLCNLGGLTSEEMMRSISGLTVPKHFSDMRITNLDRDHWLFLTQSDPLKQITLHEVMLGFAFAVSHEVHAFHNEDVWHETVAMPTIKPTRLEFGIRFRPKKPSDSMDKWILPEIQFNAIVGG